MSLPPLAQNTLKRGVLSAAAFSPHLFFPAEARACAVCFGAPGSDLAETISLSILFMIGVTAVMLAGLGLFVLTLRRRARAAGPRPPADEFGADILPSPQTRQR